MSEKSILEQALLQVQTLEEAVKQNAKGILASTMKEELSDLLKESLEEEEKVADDEEMKNPMDEQPTPDEEEDDMSDDDATADDAEADDAENDTDLDNEDPTKGIEDMDSDDESDDADTSMDDFGGDDFGSDEEDSDDDVMDMTGASDEEVLKVFKAMKPEDGIVVKKDGNKIELETGDDEFIIKLDGDDDDSELEEEWTEEETPVADDEEALYEIELDEEDEDEDELNESALKGLSKPKKVEPKESALKGLSKPKKVEPKESALAGLSKPKKVEPKESALKGLSKPKKVEPKEETEEVETEVGEAARTFGNDVRKPANQGKKYKAGRHEMNEEVENLKKQNAEYKKALVLFKDKLNEVAVFNANLAYATRLFTEHSTTKQEKLTILKRFDGISTLSEAKNLFSQIKTELGTKTNVTESVVEKISNAPSTSSSQEVLAESKAYENPQFKRMKDLMSKIK
jgi:hypothetical protein